MRRLLSGPGAQICNECIGLVEEILDQERGHPAARAGGPAPAAKLAHCSFCGQPQTAVWKLVAGPGAYICDGCFGLAREALERDAPSPDFHPTADSVDAKLAQLRQAKATFDQLNQMLVPSIDRLRMEGVSWARIGEALGMSRQAAWERFSGEE